MKFSAEVVHFLVSWLSLTGNPAYQLPVPAQRSVAIPTTPIPVPTPTTIPDPLRILTKQTPVPVHPSISSSASLNTRVSEGIHDASNNLSVDLVPQAQSSSHVKDVPFRVPGGSFRRPFAWKPPMSQWSLLADIHQFPAATLETILPQLCSLLVERDAVEGSDTTLPRNGINTQGDGIYPDGDYCLLSENTVDVFNPSTHIFDYMESMIIDKCSACLPLAMKLYNYLLCMSSSPSTRLFSNPFTAANPFKQNQRANREDRIRSLTRKIELACLLGTASRYQSGELTQSYSGSRALLRARGMFFKEQQSFMESLCTLSEELVSYPGTIHIFTGCRS
jgi:hypothetical protein